MKTLLSITLFLTCAIAMPQSQERSQVITGNITAKQTGEPIAKALITIKDTFLETETNANGYFTIAVFPDSELIVTAFLMDSKTVVVPEKSEHLDITLNYNAELLETVLLDEKEKESNNKSFKTGMGEKNRTKVGYAVDTSREEIISASDIDMYNVARKIPFLYVQGNTIGQQIVFTRRSLGAIGTSRVPLQVIVDGVMVDQNILAIIDPATVEDLTILRSLAATVKYGAIGAGGVMIISTKGNTVKESISKNFSNALAEDNNYTEVVIPVSEKLEIETSSFINEIEPYTNVEDAMVVYREQKKRPETRNLAYYIDMSNYFRKWGDKYGYIVLSDLYGQAQDNPRILKTIAFILEERGHLEQALFLFLVFQKQV